MSDTKPKSTSSLAREIQSELAALRTTMREICSRIDSLEIKVMTLRGQVNTLKRSAGREGR